MPPSGTCSAVPALVPGADRGREVDASSDIFSRRRCRLRDAHRPSPASKPTRQPQVMLKIVNDCAAHGSTTASCRRRSRPRWRVRSRRRRRALRACGRLWTRSENRQGEHAECTRDCDVIIDRSKLNLPPRSQAPPAAPQPMPQPRLRSRTATTSGRREWADPRMPALAVVLAGDIAWYTC
jgi:hypothetical protein